MICRSSKLVAGPVILALVATLAAPAVAAPAAARLEGVLIDVDGRAARGYTVHLIDAAGQDVARGATSPGGHYSIGDLAAGEYGMGIENPAGQLAPVAAPPVRLAAGKSARRNVRLVAADPRTRDGAAGGSYSVGVWWAGLSPAAKAWAIIGAVAVAGISAAALQSNDDSPNEVPATP